MKMRSIILISLCTIVVLTSNAQYKKLLKGEKNPYDTAVVIEIKTYRAETAWMKEARQLIDSLTKEIHLLEFLIAQHDTAEQSLKALVKRKDEMLERKDELLSEYNREYGKLHQAFNEEIDNNKKRHRITVGGIVVIALLIIMI